MLNDLNNNSGQFDSEINSSFDDAGRKIKSTGTNIAKKELKRQGKKARNATQRGAKKAVRKASGLVKKGAKIIGKAALQIGKATIKALISLLSNPIGWIIIIVLIILFCFLMIVDDDKADSKNHSNEVLSNSSDDYALYDAQDALSATFYSKYSDQSFYFTLSEPDDQAKQDEIDKYSGKSYDVLKGITNKGLTQSSYTNYIADIDGYEEVVKLSTTMLSALDNELNGAGNGGYYYPEQFIKPLYTGDSCDLNSDDLDIRDCELGKLDKAESTKYEIIGDNEIYYTLIDGVKEEGTNDYGLGSLVHYQAYYQPSKITDYKIRTVTYVNQDWSYDDGGSPLLSGVAWNSLSTDEQNEILEEYKYKEGNYTPAKQQGLLDDGQTGIYNVENEIVYKDWSKAYYADEQKRIANEENTMYTGLAWEKWASSDPLISTGLLDTSVVYAIDSATTYLSKIDFGVSQKWTDIGKSTHTQTGTYLKDYYSSESVKQSTWNIRSINGATSLKRLYIDDNNKGYMITNPVWTDGTYTESYYMEEGKNTVKNTTEWCNNVYTPSNPQYNDCLSGYHEDTYWYPVYTIELDPGYWSFNIVRNKNGESVSETIIVEVDNGPGKQEDTNKDSLYSNYRRQYPADYGKDECNWRYEPSYLFSINAITEGTLQVNLVVHEKDKILADDNVLSYIQDYIDNYKAYIPYGSENFNCYKSSSDDLNESMPTGSATKKEVVEQKQCKDNEYALSTFNNNVMTKLNIESLTSLQSKKIANILGVEDNDTEDNIVAFNEDKLIDTTVYDNTQNTSKSSEITKTYGKIIEKYTNAYGIDSNIIVAIIDAADGIDKNNLTNVRCDAISGCELKNVNNFSNAKEINKNSVYKENFIINDNLSDEEAIKMATAKMQLLMEKYDGNLLLAILDYSLGEQATYQLLKIYEKQEGFPVEASIEDKYNATWYHFIDEILMNTDAYNISLNNGASKQFIKDFFEKLQSVRIIWNRLKDNGAIASIIWTKTSVYDELDGKVLKTDNPVVTKALYFLRKNDGENIKKYWDVLVSGQKSWDSSIMEVENKIEIKNPDMAILYIPELTDLGKESALEHILGIDSDKDMREIGMSSKRYLVSKLGFLNIEPDYKDILGIKITTPADTYETIQSFGYDPQKIGESAYSKSWIIKVEEGKDVYSISDGTIIDSGNDGVVVESPNGALITYSGLNNINEDLSENVFGEVVGKSDGEVKISVYYKDEYYDMEAFVQTYLDSSSASSAAFWSITKHLNFIALSDAESEALWAIIDAMRDSGESILGGGPKQCTRFTNYMATIYWGDALKARYGNNLHVYGDGWEKAKLFSETFPELLVPERSELPDEGENILFSWKDGSYGHTGWINECKYDPSMDGNGYVIISHGNVDYKGGISLNQRFTWDEWHSSYGGNATYTWMK